MTELRVKAITDFLEDKTHLDVPGNALLVYHHGKEIFRHFTGDAQPDTLFRICSMTKVFTVTAALQLYEQGKFAMDDPLSMYIPEYAHSTLWDAEKEQAVPTSGPILIRHLFTMSAGITYGGDWCETGRRIIAINRKNGEQFGVKGVSTLEYVRQLADVPLLFEPGTHWNYSLCHDILGGLVEVLSGMTLGEYMKQYIFDPLGLENTFFRYPADKKEKLATLPHATHFDAGYTPESRYESGGGGLLSTADDYMRFAVAMANGGVGSNGRRILGRKTIDLLRMDQLNAAQKADFNWDYLKGYSYGLGVRTLVDPAASGIPGTVGEFGWCGYLGTWVLIDPEEQLAAVYMHQREPNLEKYVQTHLRPMIYSLI